MLISSPAVYSITLNPELRGETVVIGARRQSQSDRSNVCHWPFRDDLVPDSCRVWASFLGLKASISLVPG